MLKNYKFVKRKISSSLYYLKFTAESRIFFLPSYLYVLKVFSHSYYHWHVWKFRTYQRACQLKFSLVLNNERNSHTHEFLSFTFNAFHFNSPSSIGSRLTRVDIELGIEENWVKIGEKFPFNWPLFQFSNLSRSILPYFFFLVSRDLKTF